MQGAVQFGDAERFRGPVPLMWLLTAARLPGRALHVAIALWYAAQVSREPSVHLSNTLCERFGLDRNAKYRGLDLLEATGLVSVERKRGRSPTVTILDCNGTP
jgi:hypothetical protein